MHNQQQRLSGPAARAAAAACLAVALAGCGSLSTVAPEGTADRPVFPDASRATVKDGAWPNPDNLRSVRAGMSKAQLYALLGTPHFSEGLIGVREWDYLFHLQSKDGPILCQYKVLFDQDRLARTFLWKPASCADALGQADGS
ncbi:outer membrane protein assembly factor BamE [Burkholderia anthina]|uniref:Outer membrane protein assembly factor BamE n=1 Tax=Burkholderia anthina TaxID=179879 RepID=A0A6P2GLZ7_9BURK|nr:outer membrane protein assembly factor BamE [Burkholderia anthina]MBM2769228.1 outer membrane protein assembly factor BamE [Burkholderia anthina]VVU54003.1 SmpA/OmlA family lipoprotein [Burkholderia anthina]